MFWKNDIEVWLMLADIEVKRRGPTLYLAITGITRETVGDIKPTELEGDKNVEIILLK